MCCLFWPTGPYYDFKLCYFIFFSFNYHWIVLLLKTGPQWTTVNIHIRWYRMTYSGQARLQGYGDDGDDDEGGWASCVLCGLAFFTFISWLLKGWTIYTHTCMCAYTLTVNPARPQGAHYKHTPENDITCVMVILFQSSFRKLHNCILWWLFIMCLTICSVCVCVCVLL